VIIGYRPERRAAGERFEAGTVVGLHHDAAGTMVLARATADAALVGVGLGRIVALCYRSSTLYQIH
jgi:hypothetical protein